MLSALAKSHEGHVGALRGGCLGHLIHVDRALHDGVPESFHHGREKIQSV
ncbi:MAG TPA: hypothetical protein VNG93_14180 [Candidatus Dormibacteraeota bacterium]|nr:hypothetical protein [Candidatus Dormibacteraeota bacterium]